MRRQIARLSLVATLAAACTLCASAWANAATARFDTSYQNGGTVQLPHVSSIFGQVVQTCEISGDRLNVAGRFGPNSPGLPTMWRRDQSLMTTAVKIRPRQPMTLGIADVTWQKQRIPTGQIVLGQDFDVEGGFAYVTRSQRTALRTKLMVFRILPNGRRAAKFGHNGYTSVTIPGLTSLRPVGFRVIALPGGRVFVLAQTAKSQILLRFTSTGKPDGKWGEKGVVTLAGPARHSAVAPDALASATALPDGGLLLSASGLPGQTSGGDLGLIKLSSSGKVDTSWATNGFWKPPAASAPQSTLPAYDVLGRTILTSIRKGGDYAVLYADARSSETGTASDLKLAYVDSKSGVTTLFNEKAGEYSDDGDGGFPDSEPWTLGETSAGTAFAQARTRYSNPGFSNGQAGRFSVDANQPITDLSISVKEFTADAFAVDPKSTFLYFCGSLGSTSARATIPVNRQQRKTIAIRRVKL
ncbi:MAG: hypothetical protein ACSLFF_11480 [Solirubrobacterales bacterium]